MLLLRDTGQGFGCGCTSRSSTVWITPPIEQSSFFALAHPRLCQQKCSCGFLMYHRSDQDGIFFSRFLFSPPRSPPWNLLPHSCINSWLWQSTGREVGWTPMSKEGEPGLFKLPLPSEKCSKNHSSSCMKSKSTGLDCQLLSVCMKNLYKTGRPLPTNMRPALICFFLGAVVSAMDHAGCSKLYCWIASRSSFEPLKKQLPEVN